MDFKKLICTVSIVIVLTIMLPFQVMAAEVSVSQTSNGSVPYLTYGGSSNLYVDGHIYSSDSVRFTYRSDDTTLEGYYWGNSQNYQENKYYSFSEKLMTNYITITPQSSGAFYLNVIDSNGNVSETDVTTFYEVRLHANNNISSFFFIRGTLVDPIIFPLPTKTGFEFKGWGSSESDDIVMRAFNIYYDEDLYALWSKNSKKQQIITSAQSSYVKSYGSKSFSLKAKTSGNGKLTYKTSNKKVVSVSSKGKVTIKGCGKATVTIKAAATSKYKSASKKISITVKPAKVKIKSGSGNKKIFTIKIVPQKTVSGYEAVYNGIKKKINKNATTFVITNPQKGKSFKIRAYKKTGNKTIYGSYTKVNLVF